MQLNPYLMFNGQCAAALKFYEKCLGGKIVMKTTYGESPMDGETPPAWRKKILHATLAVGEQVLGAADAPPERYRKPQGFYVALHLTGAAKADRIFAALAKKGAVQMPIQQTSWALRFGMLVDRFGTPWMVDC